MQKVTCIEPPLDYCRSTKANFTVGAFYVMGMVGIQDNLMRPKFSKPNASKILTEFSKLNASKILTEFSKLNASKTKV